MKFMHKSSPYMSIGDMFTVAIGVAAAAAIILLCLSAILCILTCVLIVLKLVGVIATTWWGVFAPVWGPVALLAGTALAVIVIGYIINLGIFIYRICTFRKRRGVK